MDGNQRWSKKNNISIDDGYYKGFFKLKEIVKYCIDEKIKHLTVYALSTENLKRDSVKNIFKIITSNYKEFLKEIIFVNNVKIKIIGENYNLSNRLNTIFNKIENFTVNNKELNLNIAFNYGSDQELISIINEYKNVDNNIIPNDKMKLIKSLMYLKETPEPDLLIRTGGYQRLSNFLLLYLGYTELFFTKTLWPNFTIAELKRIIKTFKKIKRKYGL